jgi:hypothetical protein
MANFLYLASPYSESQILDKILAPLPFAFDSQVQLLSSFDALVQLLSHFHDRYCPSAFCRGHETSPS